MPVSFPDLALAIVIVAFAATVQGVIGIGFNVISVPILLLIDPLLAPVPNLLIAVPLSVFMVVRERGSIDRSGVGWILLGRIPGGLIGLGLLLTLNSRGLDVTLALIVLLAVFIVGTGVALRRNRATEFGTGVVSGVTGIVGAIGGPPLGILYRDAAGPTVRSTLAVVFSVGLMLSIVFRTVGGQIAATDLQIALYLLPAMALGLGLSSRVKDRFEGIWIKRGILTISALAATALLLRSLTG